MAVELVAGVRTVFFWAVTQRIKLFRKVGEELPLLAV